VKRYSCDFSENGKAVRRLIWSDASDFQQKNEMLFFLLSSFSALPMNFNANSEITGVVQEIGKLAAKDSAFKENSANKFIGEFVQVPFPRTSSISNFPGPPLVEVRPFTRQNLIKQAHNAVSASQQSSISSNKELNLHSFDNERSKFLSGFDNVVSHTPATFKGLNRVQAQELRDYGFADSDIDTMDLKQYLLILDRIYESI
jgi:hypothetical protein